MKIRNGFVSNSSSSSFIVKLKDWLTDKSTGITKIQIIKLLNFGFVYTNNNVWQIDTNNKVKKSSKCSADRLGYWIIVNEDDVIQFLVDNRIPFEGLTHYGHNAVIYDGESTIVTFYANLGNKVLMYRKADKVTSFIDQKLLKVASWEEDYSNESTISK